MLGIWTRYSNACPGVTIIGAVRVIGNCGAVFVACAMLAPKVTALRANATRRRVSRAVERRSACARLFTLEARETVLSVVSVFIFSSFAAGALVEVLFVSRSVLYLAPNKKPGVNSKDSVGRLLSLVAISDRFVQKSTNKNSGCNLELSEGKACLLLSQIFLLNRKK